MTSLEISEGRGMRAEKVSGNDEEMERAVADTDNGKGVIA